MPRSLRVFFIVLLCVWVGLASAQALVVPKPGPRDLCPVCGMLVSKYPNWVATVLYRNGHAHHFDGAKDMFKYLFDLPKYAPNHRREDIMTIAVTDYYNLQKVDAKNAFYVIGSDVLGPMGHELIPLATRTDAEDFLREHKGQKILRFDQVTRDLPARLDDGKF
ncbi:MAG: nitrous oxide reductase accessory protein NosL [Rhodocyclaceae bacterium]|nr:nitrous oxide reductase accessory protein NosL [Rhodocyclaceae bacterium]MDP1956841.1 nitrous oxide reductase accessory protein NosL [Rhodocyclaceae bacterium]